MNELQLLQNGLAALATGVENVKKDFEAYISDKSVPLNTRWTLFVEAPAFMRNTSEYIEHFTTFNDHEVYEDWINRGQVVSLLMTVEIMEESENFDDNEGVKKISAFKEEILAKNLGAVTFDW